MATKIQLRRDTAANWSSENTVLSQGEIGYDLTNDRFKIGDGSTAWNSLGYATEALGHNHDDRYYTEAEVDTLLDAKEDSNANIQSHITDTNNPHTVTKAQVGLGDVENYGIASLAEAEAGTATNKYMTPERTKEAILELSPPTDLSTVNSHIADDTIHFTQSAISITESQISNFGSYEPAFVKNTAFNKNFGTGSGQVAEGDHTHTFAEITNKPTTLSGYGITDSLYTQTEIDSLLTPKATESYVDTAISNLVNGANESFDTLGKIQDAMATDAELSAAIAGLTIGNGTQTVSAGGGLTGGGSFTANQTGNSTVTIDHADTSTQGSTNNSGRTYIQNIALDTYGHITGLTTATETVANTDTNYYLTGVSGSGDGTVTFTRQGLPNLTWNAAHSHSEYLTSLPTHNHNDLYYTESEVNSLLSGKLGSTATAVNSDKVDGYHIVVGSTGSDTNTLYFIT